MYLSVAGSTITVHLDRFALFGVDHVGLHRAFIDNILRSHDTFAVEVDASCFGAIHLAATSIFIRLALLCRRSYKGKLSAIVVYNTPALLLRAARTLRPYIGTETWAKIDFRDKGV